MIQMYPSLYYAGGTACLFFTSGENSGRGKENAVNTLLYRDFTERTRTEGVTLTSKNLRP